MNTITVAVGSTRTPKLEAVRQALAAYRASPQATPDESHFEVVGINVGSGVGHTPRTRAELMAGARGRAEALRKLAEEGRHGWSYFIGLEGGLDVVQENGRRWVFLENWAYVADTTGRECYGQAGGIVLPDPLAEEVLDRGTELAVAIDSYAGGRGISDAQGAWGVLTRNLVTRQDAYRLALIQAFAPFFNKRAYPDVSQ